MLQTTLSGRGYVRRIEQWKNLGYRVELLFLSLSSPEAAVDRVAKRVAQGGHAVPEEVVRRRFYAGRKNFEEIYRGVVDSWTIYDASGRHLCIVSTDDCGK